MDRSPHCDVTALTALIRERARALGASAVRFTAAARDAGAEEAMRASFARGDFRTWPYDDSYAARAADPRSLLAQARSVIVLAFPYRTAAPGVHPLEGRVSSYAWSKDYHRRIKARLYELAASIDEAAGRPVTAVACDTKALAERSLAARSGLGWIGKHTNAITPEAGSFVFLAEIVTTIALPPDEPLKKTCGACTRCIPACPTGALRGDYTIDATRCISDLTQRTDGIPRTMRAAIGIWVWGCDICQDVCPPNARATIAGSAEDEPVDRHTASPNLLSLLQLRSGDFKRRYRSTAMGWRGAAVLRRNAAVALGNSLDRSTVPALIGAMRSDPHAMVRGHAAWALGKIASPPAIAALEQALPGESDESVRSEIVAALEPVREGTSLSGI